MPEFNQHGPRRAGHAGSDKKQGSVEKPGIAEPPVETDAEHEPHADAVARGIGEELQYGRSPGQEDFRGIPEPLGGLSRKYVIPDQVGMKIMSRGQAQYIIRENALFFDMAVRLSLSF